MPRRSQPDMLAGSVRAFGVALRTGYAPRAPYGGPVAFAFVADPSLGADDDARRQDDTFAAWQRWAPAATRWKAPGNHLTVLQPPHVSSLAAWWKRINTDSGDVARGA
jgi:thioesterase domain-containing protein